MAPEVLAGEKYLFEADMYRYTRSPFSLYLLLKNIKTLLV